MTVRSSRLLIFGFFLMSLVFLSIFADRDGYEGDDLNSIVPMFHLQEAKRHDLLIYRYDWQPLSYEVGALVFKVTRNPCLIFLLAPVAGATSLVLLLSIVWRRPSVESFVKAIVAITAVPELWFSGLYFNSTILGLPFALGSFALLRSSPRTPLLFLAGILLGTAALMRFDFVLAGPALALIAWKYGRSLAAPFFLFSGTVTVLGFALLAGLVDPIQVLEIYRSSAGEIAAKAYMPGWDLRTKLGVLSVTLSPLGWLIILVGGPITVFEWFRNNTSTAILWSLALVPLCLPLPNLLSVKYALPLLMFLPSFLVLAISSIETWIPFSLQRSLLPVLVFASLVLALVSISFTGTSPFVHVNTFAYREVGTHDGTRSYGGYLWQVAAVDRLAPPTDHQLIARQVVQDFFEKEGPDIVAVGGENFFDRGGAGWRDLQLYLEQSNIHGTLVAPHELQFSFRQRKLTLLRDLPDDYATRFDRGRGVRLYDWRED